MHLQKRAIPILNKQMPTDVPTLKELEREIITEPFVNPLRPNNDESQTSHCNIKGVSVSEVMRIENMITQVQFY